MLRPAKTSCSEGVLWMCPKNSLSINDTWFPRKNIYKCTWYSPDGRTQKLLDHILISSCWKSSITNCCVYRGAQLGNTDHHLLVAQLRLKLKATPKQVQPWLLASHLQDLTITTAFACSISNRYGVLAAEQLTNWNHFVIPVNQAAADSIGRPRPTPRCTWISPTHWRSSTAEELHI